MEEFKEEIQELKNKIQEIETKYWFTKNYKIITTLLDKLNVEKIEIDKKDIENNYSEYLMTTEEDKVTIKKIK